MKKTFKDIQQNILLALLKPLVYIWMRIDSKRKVHKGEGINFRRNEPYIMLANHTFMFDVVHVPLRWKIVPYIIASQTLFTKQPAKFLVTQVAHVIPKAKGRRDLITIKKIFNVIKKGYPVLIFPEGDTTFYGETGHIETSTMKLIKKLKLDVVTCNVKGGYLSKPRWATGKRKNHKIELFYNLTINRDKLDKMTVNEISTVINDALYHDDYKYQREKMIPHPGKKLAEGIENVIYVCPHCESINTIVSDNNTIKCTECKNEGYMDKFGFIHGFKFDNLIDWNEFQRNFSDKLRKSVIESEGLLNYMKIETEEQIPLGRITITYKNENIYISGAQELVIPVSEIQNATITLRRDFGFLYNNKHYLIKLDQYGASFLRIVQDKY
ncbi:lysophospholipid acyltransferase family protein [Mycoplasmatota bacterium WC30]